MIKPTPPPLQFEGPPPSDWPSSDSPPSERQSSDRPPDKVVDRIIRQDECHLDWLVAGCRLVALFALVAGIYQGGWLALKGRRTGSLTAWGSISFPENPMWDGTGAARSDLTMWIYGSTLVLAGLLIALVLRWLAQALEQRKRLELCQLAGMLMCFTGPLGIALGIFTLMVLHRPGVAWLFGRKG